MKLGWKHRHRGGNLRLPTGEQLRALCRRGRVAFRGNALELTGQLPRTGQSAGLSLCIDYPFADLKHIWMPHLTPTDRHVVGDFVFRSPAVLLATRRVAVAVVIDVDDVAKAEDYRIWLDYDHARRRLRITAGAYEKEGHVFFVAKPISGRGQTVRLRAHVLVSVSRRDLANPYGMVVRFLWKHWGRRGFEENAISSVVLDSLAAHATRFAFGTGGWSETVWQSPVLNGEAVGAPVFIVDVAQHPSIPIEQRRWREPRSVWNQAWFSTQRCANGLSRYAKRTGSSDLSDRARAMTGLALHAPIDNGLFPSVLRASPTIDAHALGARAWEGAIWTHSDRRPPSATPLACHIVDAAFTCRMLLEWYDLSGDVRALARVTTFAYRLLSLQEPRGSFPGWVEPNGDLVDELRASAESAVGVTLLLELAQVTADPDVARRMRRGAMAGLRFLEPLVARGQWEDFEAYYSCAPWGQDSQIGRKVVRNGIFKQNTLAIFWCAEAFLAAHRWTKDPRHLELAKRCVDELSLYQAVWSPPFLTAPGHGGFGVMNGDCEWNDARQSLFAPIYFELYERTGIDEYLERGASAVRASFSMMYCPENSLLAQAYERRFPFFGRESYGFMMENQGHHADDSLGTFSIYTWGSGSALSAMELLRDRYPSAFHRAFRGFA